MKHFWLAIAGACALSACGDGTEADESAASETVVEEVEGEIVASGSFSGLSDHVTSGRVTVRQTGDGYVVVLEEDFSLDGAPDPTLGFGDGEQFLTDTQFSDLRSNTGRQVYELPAELDPTQYAEIYVWCEQFSVPLGVAALN